MYATVSHIPPLKLWQQKKFEEYEKKIKEIIQFFEKQESLVELNG